jgi:hypothetical protein
VGRSRIAPVKERHQAELARLEEAFGVEGNRGWPPGVKQRLTKRFERLERQEQRRALDLLLDDLASYLRDLLAVQAGGPRRADLVNLDHEAAMRRDAERLPAADASRRCRRSPAAARRSTATAARSCSSSGCCYAIALPLYRSLRCAPPATPPRPDGLGRRA